MYVGMAMAGGMAIRKMGRVVGSAAKFGFEMEFVKQISKSTDDQMVKMSEQAMDLGQKTIFFAKDVAEGMRFMAMAGMGYKEVTGNIGAAVDLAAAANLSIAGRGGSADIMTNIMKAFKKDASESAYIADILAEAATSANTNVFELGEALKYAGSTAMDLAIPLEEASAMAMTLANAGMQGSMAGVAMENSMRYLARSISEFASGTQKKALAQAGLSSKDFQDANGDLNSMVENIGVLRTALAGMGNVQKQAILQTLFGVRGKRAGSLLIRNYTEFLGHLGRFQDAHGRASEISSGMMDTLEGSFLRLKAVWTHLGIFFTKGIEPILRPLASMLEGIVKAMQWLFKIPVLGNFLATGIASFIVIKTVAFAYKAVVTGLRAAHLMARASAIEMAGATTTGYNTMTAAAGRYTRAAAVANATNRAGMSQMVGAGMVKGLALNKAGRIINAKTGRFVATSAASSLAAGTARMAGNKIVAQGATRMMLGRLLGVFGGPVGFALSFVLPGLIGAAVSAIKSSKDSTDKNTRSMEEATRAQIRAQMQYTRVGHMIQFQDLQTPKPIVGTTTIGQISPNINATDLGKLSDSIQKLLEAKTAQPIIINIDNEQSVQKVLEKNIADSLSIMQ
jgi:TP901 family phage tail tape measure protein